MPKQSPMERILETLAHRYGEGFFNPELRVDTVPLTAFQRKTETLAVNPSPVLARVHIDNLTMEWFHVTRHCGFGIYFAVLAGFGNGIFLKIDSSGAVWLLKEIQEQAA